MYISIKHAPTSQEYTVEIQCTQLTSSVGARAIHDTLIEEINNIVEFYKHLGIFKNTREVQEALAFGSCFPALLSCS